MLGKFLNLAQKDHFRSDSCDNNCPSNARCENGVCYCNDGYEADQNCQKRGANNLACTLNQCIPVKFWVIQLEGAKRAILDSILVRF